MNSQKFLKSSIGVVIIANSANIFAYLFQFIMGRYLSVEGFGILNAVNSLGVVIGAIAGIIPYVVTKYVIKYKENKDLVALLIWNISKFTIFICIVIIILVIVFIDYIDSYLNLNDNLPIYIFLISMITLIFVNILLAIMRGILQYIQVAVKSVLITFFKLIFAIILVVWLEYGYNGALSAAIFSNLFVGVLAFYTVNKYIKLYKPKDQTFPQGIYKEMLKYVIPVGLVWFSIGVLVNFDIIFVKHYTNAIEAGEYSVAAIIGRIAVFLPGVLLHVLFPQVSQNSQDGKSSVGTIVIVMALTLLLSGGFTTIVYFFPEYIIIKLFGVKYINAANVLVTITFAMSLVAVLSVLFNFFLAKQIYNFLYISLVIIIGIGFTITQFFHNSSLEIASVILYGMVILVAVNFMIMLYYYYFKK